MKTKVKKETEVEASEDDLDDDDFEHIDIDDELGYSEEEDAEEEDDLKPFFVQVESQKNFNNVACEKCCENAEEKILELDGCAHCFCTKCIADELMQRARFNNMSLNCLVSFKILTIK